ncbi:cytochrome P450 [Russula vinacea]|nr:cytochrome P450 [Russula vinacea]
MPVVSLTSALVLVSSLATYFAFRDYQRRRGIPYPPGPRRLPLIGNLLDIPKEFPWLSFTRLSETHGDVLSFHVFGKVVVVLNSFKANKDLLERRGDIYSDRPVIPIINMMKWEWIVGFSRNTESWRLARKLLDRSLRPAAIAAYRPLLQKKAHVLLTQVLANPDELEAHLNQFVL